ncbi:glutamate--tRNA ligase [soil metagenome]
MARPVRTRFAPSPTGFLHVGGARTALFSWLWARKNGGQFLLRIEDTDVERSTEASVDQILESLKWLGLDWDEGPFFQTQRLDIYREHLDRLLRDGKIYPAFESKEELDAERDKAMAEKRNPIYNRASLKLSPEEIKQRTDAGVPFAYRFKAPDEGYTEIPETLRGDNDVKFENSAIGDFIITRPGTTEKPGMPLYNFVCAVDDALMNITHVIRGMEHLPNTPKQVLLLKAFGYDIPTYTHLPLVMKGAKKMSKRDAEADPRYPVSVSGRRDLGYLPEATINFISLLGWSFPGGEELYTREQLTENFTLDRLVKANANFDEDKYLFQNGWYIRNMPREAVVERVKPFLERAGLSAEGRDVKWLGDIIALELERCKLLSEFPPALEYFFKAPASYDPKGIKKVFAVEGIAQQLSDAANVLEAVSPFTKEAMETALREQGEKSGLGFGKIAQPIRLAVTGRTASPGLFEVLELLGKDETVSRVRKVAAVLASGAALPATEAPAP